ncbi:MAG: hypothetical protein ACLTGK_03910, partial [Eubacterium sp.]
IISAEKKKLYMIKLSNCSGLKENDAIKIDTILKGMRFAGNITVQSESKIKKRSKALFRI